MNTLVGTPKIKPQICLTFQNLIPTSFSKKKHKFHKLQHYVGNALPSEFKNTVEIKV